MYAESNHNQAGDELPPLRSLHSSNLPGILEELGVTLMVTTYQAGKLVLVRPDNGVINTHFRAFNQPMGLAIGNERLAIGTEQEIIEFRNRHFVHRVSSRCSNSGSESIVTNRLAVV